MLISKQQISEGFLCPVSCSNRILVTGAKDGPDKTFHREVLGTLARNVVDRPKELVDAALPCKREGALPRGTVRAAAGRHAGVWAYRTERVHGTTGPLTKYS